MQAVQLPHAPVCGRQSCKHDAPILCCRCGGQYSAVIFAVKTQKVSLTTCECIRRSLSSDWCAQRSVDWVGATGIDMRLLCAIRTAHPGDPPSFVGYLFAMLCDPVKFAHPYCRWAPPARPRRSPMPHRALLLPQLFHLLLLDRTRAAKALRCPAVPLRHSLSFLLFVTQLAVQPLNIMQVAEQHTQIWLTWLHAFQGGGHAIHPHQRRFRAGADLGALF